MGFGYMILAGWSFCTLVVTWVLFNSLVFNLTLLVFFHGGIRGRELLSVISEKY